jgi:hypothetical protein
MKSLMTAVAAAAALSMSSAAFSQADTGLTRAQVRAELQQLEQAGYSPGRGNDPHYPEDIQAAEARVANHQSASDYGGMTSGSSASSSRAVVRPASPDEMRQIYSGGQ